MQKQKYNLSRGYFKKLNVIYHSSLQKEKLYIVIKR